MRGAVFLPFRSANEQVATNSGSFPSFFDQAPDSFDSLGANERFAEKELDQAPGHIWFFFGCFLRFLSQFLARFPLSFMLISRRVVFWGTDMAFGLECTSRLACQIILTKELVRDYLLYFSPILALFCQIILTKELVRDYLLYFSPILALF